MTKSINPDELLTVSQAADERGTTRQAINYLVRQGKLETVEIAGRRFITRRALAQYVPDPGGRPPKEKTEEEPKAAKKKGLGGEAAKSSYATVENAPPGKKKASKR